MTLRRLASLLAVTTSVSTSLLGGCVVVPSELTQPQLSAIADEKLSVVTAGQEAVSGPIDLYEAMARALKYNLDHQVEMAEQAVRERELDLAHFSLLPTAVAESGYAARDKFSASNSVNVFTGVESLATSTSQDKRLRTSDIEFGWNVLDFGLSYVKARQAADKVLIQNELPSGVPSARSGFSAAWSGSRARLDPSRSRPAVLPPISRPRRSPHSPTSVKSSKFSAPSAS